MKPEDIAVIYRDNKDAFAIAEMLEKSGIPFQIESDSDVFADPIIKKLLIVARAVNDYGDNRALADFLHLDIFDIQCRLPNTRVNLTVT